jgi:hypothetical protein
MVEQLALQQTAPVFQQFPIPASPQALRIGRTPDNQIVQDDDAVSRRHATLWEQDGQAFVRDEQSTNGTLVDGQPIPSQVPFPLHPGSEIRVGLATFLVTALSAPVVEGPPPIPPTKSASSSAVWIIAGAAGLAVLVLAALMIRPGQTSYPVTPLPTRLTATVTVAPTLTTLPSTATPTVVPTPTTSVVTPAQPVTPTLPAVQSLQDMLKQARQHMEAFGGTIDQAGGGRPDCRAIVADYDAVEKTPTWSAPPDLAGLYSEYRKAVDLFLNTGHDLYLNCKQNPSGGGSFPGLQVGMARQGVADALGILEPVSEQVGKLR